MCQSNTTGFLHKAGVTARGKAGFLREAAPTVQAAVSTHKGDQRPPLSGGKSEKSRALNLAS